VAYKSVESTRLQGRLNGRDKMTIHVVIPRRRCIETRRFCFSSPTEQYNQIRNLSTTTHTKTHTQT